ncbi:NADH dehydrogenase 1 beta subcomplex subunit 10 [Trichonephila inaurata madagascariensis]|uniref:NADH dehydrogenase [ubiquinone] 1 beta subcomplex subunit 10 n=1 Tax=Trichonephila inaurata madagascariensis TaxID=2747483 RepID=A0A8X6XW09_9ARAC|nr:NADH dehydrogenase 1 beta subcomplex subunit 10 [Trichonephila inaurata madagascariensis]
MLPPIFSPEKSYFFSLTYFVRLDTSNFQSTSNMPWGGEERNIFDRFMNKMINLVDGPVTWFRETVVVPNQKQYPYYHRVYRPNEQFKRDMSVDGAIVDILRKRKVECARYEGYEREEKCRKIFQDYTEAELNYFIKYGDLGAYAHAKFAYMKQKHRMVYERRKAAGTWNPNP